MTSWIATSRDQQPYGKIRKDEPECIPLPAVISGCMASNPANNLPCLDQNSLHVAGGRFCTYPSGLGCNRIAFENLCPCFAMETSYAAIYEIIFSQQWTSGIEALYGFKLEQFDLLIYNVGDVRKNFHRIVVTSRRFEESHRNTDCQTCDNWRF